MDNLNTAQAPAMALDLADDIPVAYRPDEVAREATRWLVFLGDIQSPREKRDKANPLGGEHYGQQFPCLVRTKGQLRRAQLTPLEIGYDFINDEILGDNPNKLLVSSIVAGPEKAIINLGGKLNAVPMYPGDQVKGILIGDYNQDRDKGVVEAKALIGVEYTDFKKSGIQEFIFPNWAKTIAGIKEFALPTKLNDLLLHISNRRKETTDETLRSVIDTYLDSGERFRNWGRNYLKTSTMLVRQPAHQGFVHTYSDVAELLFDQLEIKREDLIRESSDPGMAEAIEKLSAGGIGTGEILQMLKLMAEQQEVIRKIMSGEVPVGVQAPVETVPVVDQTIPEVQTSTPIAQAAAQPLHTDRQQEKLDPRLCQVIGSTTGRQCQRMAGENGRCDLPAHQPKNA